MKAAAMIVGPVDGPGAMLTSLAHRLGFAAVRRYAGVGDAEAQAQFTPILFFLFTGPKSPAALQRTAEAIRFCPSRKVRFSPMILLDEQPSAELIGTCIQLGFDDVISLPAPDAAVALRLERQLDRTLVFYETADYFGPDRRQAEGAGPDERRGHGRFRRMEILRGLEGGVQVVRDEFEGARTP